MSLIKILPEYLENFTLTLHPEVRYVSSSIDGGTALPTGSMPLAARPSKFVKQIVDPATVGFALANKEAREAEIAGRASAAVLSPWNAGNFSIIDVVSYLNNVIPETDIFAGMEKYMESVNSSSNPPRNTKKFNIVRFDPPFGFNLNSCEKSSIRNVLMPFYAHVYDGCQFAYTNYHTVNFFTGSEVPSNSAIIYSNLMKQSGGPATQPYSTKGAFTFDFYINPRYSNNKGMDFKAGTILHLSSSFAISLVSGSSRDSNDEVDAYRMLLQLSHSADVEPSSIDLSIENNKRDYPDDLIFLSGDNSLKRNHWHHVSIRWGRKRVNDGSGSIKIDDESYSFNVPSSSILSPNPAAGTYPQGSYYGDALFVGNYFSGFGDERDFFNNAAASVEGFYPSLGSGVSDPVNFTFSHPLNAEIHDLKIYNKYLDSESIESNRNTGQPNIKSDGLIFYVPPYFTKEGRPRDCLLSPFQTSQRTPEDPFNTRFSFGVGGYIINLPNFLREFKKKYYPRLFHLTSSAITGKADLSTANEFIYATGSSRKRNLTILPNDNGLFQPDYEFLLSGSVSTNMSKFKSAYGGYDLSIVGLNNMLPPSYRKILPPFSVDLIAGATPENLSGTVPSGTPQVSLPVYQRTGDPSSNEISIFDISNLFYGNRILPGSFYLTDPMMTGSGGEVSITLRDNGRGSLYRADCLTQQATWPNVGTILYDDGVVVVKSPHLSYFGANKFEASFKGEQNTHILTVNIPASVGMFNSSSNPQYKILSASLDANDINSRFVYITGLNLHDDNLNVIMRGNLAQPVLKRDSDGILFRFKKDF